jgi:hypothetical protein
MAEDKFGTLKTVRRFHRHMMEQIPLTDRVCHPNLGVRFRTSNMHTSRRIVGIVGKDAAIASRGSTSSSFVLFEKPV